MERRTKEQKYNSYYGTPGVRELCHTVKESKRSNGEYKWAVEKIADYLAKTKAITEDSILIPAPQHTGDALYTKDIADAVAERTGAQTLDILKCIPHKTLYKVKRAKTTDTGLCLYVTVPGLYDSDLYFVDNVISTGYTFNIANRLFRNNLKPLVYAYDDSNDRTRQIIAKYLDKTFL